MYAATRRAKIKPGQSGEFERRVRAGALPVMKEMQGFEGYYLVFGADDTVMSISFFTDKTGYENSTQALFPWIKENLGPLLASPIDYFEGEVAAHQAG